MPTLETIYYVLTIVGAVIAGLYAGVRGAVEFVRWYDRVTKGGKMPRPTSFPDQTTRIVRDFETHLTEHERVDAARFAELHKKVDANEVRSTQRFIELGDILGEIRENVGYIKGRTK